MNHPNYTLILKNKGYFFIPLFFSLMLSCCTSKVKSKKEESNFHEFSSVLRALGENNVIDKSSLRILFMHREFKLPNMNRLFGQLVTVKKKDDSLFLENKVFEFSLGGGYGISNVPVDSVFIIEKHEAKVIDTKFISDSSILQLDNHIRDNSKSFVATPSKGGFIEYNMQNYYYVDSRFNVMSFNIFHETYNLFYKNRNLLKIEKYRDFPFQDFKYYFIESDGGSVSD